MKVLPGYLDQYTDRWAFWVLVSAVGLFLLQTFRSWYRLRHFNGPFIASLSRVWLVRCATRGRLHLDFQKVNQKYGGYHPSPGG